MTTLFGRRVLLRPLTSEDFAKWQDVRRRNHDWLTKWEPERLPVSPMWSKIPRLSECVAHLDSVSVSWAQGMDWACS